jgi:hypothetical protein
LTELQAEGSAVQFCVVMPVFDDWAVAEALLKEMDAVFAGNGVRADVTLIDDGSTTPVPETLMALRPQALSKVELLSLRKNLGHQRALCVGLVHVSQRGCGLPIVVMDADGEDSPRDVLALFRRFKECSGAKVVFAARSKRAEGFVFRFFYRLFQAVHFILVGTGTRIGNFSILPQAALHRLVVTPDLWNHYAAAVVRSRFPIDTIPIARNKRLGGESKMGLVSLIAHGLSAISVYGERVGVRLLVACAGLVTVIALVLVAAAGFGALGLLELPGWAVPSAMMVLPLILQGLMISFAFTFLVLNSRADLSFIPLRDGPLFVRELRSIHAAS